MAPFIIFYYYIDVLLCNYYRKTNYSLGNKIIVGYLKVKYIVIFKK